MKTNLFLILGVLSILTAFTGSITQAGDSFVWLKNGKYNPETINKEDNSICSMNVKWTGMTILELKGTGGKPCEVLNETFSCFYSNITKRTECASADYQLNISNNSQFELVDVKNDVQILFIKAKKK